MSNENNNNGVVAGRSAATRIPNDSTYLALEEELWSLGISDGPASTALIVVAGDNSAAKMLVMSALTGGDLTATKVLYTACPSSFTWYRGANFENDVRITGLPGRTGVHQQDIVPPPTPHATLIENIDYLTTWHLPATGRDLHERFLQVTVISPQGPELTIVNLPSLTQGTGTWEVFSTLMKKPCTVGIIVEMAGVSLYPPDFKDKAIALEQHRGNLLGVIGIPSRMSERSTTEAGWCQFAKQEPKFLAHGWHVVCSPDKLTSKTTMEEKDATDAAFFARGGWASVPNKGNAQLQSHVATILSNIVQLRRTTLVYKLRREIVRYNQNRRVPAPLKNPDRGRDFIMQLAEQLKEAMPAMITESKPLGPWLPIWRLFVSRMTAFGRTIHVHYGPDQVDRFMLQPCSLDGLCVSVEEYEDELQRAFARHGGLNEGIIRQFIDDILNQAETTIRETLGQITDAKAAAALAPKVSAVWINGTRGMMLHKMRELLLDSRTQEPLIRHPEVAKAVGRFQTVRARCRQHRREQEPDHVSFLGFLVIDAVDAYYKVGTPYPDIIATEADSSQIAQDKICKDVRDCLFKDLMTKRLPDILSDTLDHLSTADLGHIDQVFSEIQEAKRIARVRSCLAELSKYSDADLPAAGYYTLPIEYQDPGQEH
ncbi:hypothetical protein F5Y17DRAFT_454803 [Xylariaceae sp. FL0594]|nr:hypothetical protein F5Y17DRAFT_454803 [Xylariaceae sp. FL0594]